MSSEENHSPSRETSKPHEEPDVPPCNRKRGRPDDNEIAELVEQIAALTLKCEQSDKDLKAQQACVRRKTYLTSTKS
jgi:hypothetical protein